MRAIGLAGKTSAYKKTCCRFSRTGVDLKPGERRRQTLRQTQSRESEVKGCFLLRPHLPFNKPIWKTALENDFNRFLTHVHRRTLRAHRHLQIERSASKQRAAPSRPLSWGDCHKNGTAIGSAVSFQHERRSGYRHLCLLSTCISLPWTKLCLAATLDLQRYSAMAPSLSSTWPSRCSRPQDDGKMASSSSLVGLETRPSIRQDGQGWARFT